MYCLPKIHKANAPLRPIVASRGSITYNAARVLTDVRVPLLAKLSTTYRTAVTLSTRSKTLRYHTLSTRSKSLRSHKARSWSPMTCQHFLPVSLCLTPSLPLNANWTAAHHYTNAPPSPANASLNCCLSAWTPRTSRTKATSTNKNMERPWVRLCPLW